MNICEYTNMIKEKQITFSKEVMVQIEQMKEVCCDALDLLLDNQANSESLHSIESIEQKIDDMTESFRKGQIDRMQTGKCSVKAVCSIRRCSPTLSVSATTS